MQRPGFDPVGTSRRSGPRCATVAHVRAEAPCLEVWDHCHPEAEKPATAMPGGRLVENVMLLRIDTVSALGSFGLNDSTS